MKSAKRQIKKRAIIFLVVIGLLLAASVGFFQFTALGYRMSVPYRGFTELLPRVYVQNSYSGDQAQILDVVTKAQDRVAAFWGDTKSRPLLIISDDPQTIARLGGDHDTSTAVLWRASSYISIAKAYLNVDIVAHELTHAELHARLYEGKLRPETLVPIWFDEGLALQNDFRPQYGGNGTVGRCASE